MVFSEGEEDSREMEDAVDRVFLNAVREDGQMSQRTPFEVKRVAEFQQGAFDRGDVEDDRSLARFD